MSTNAPIVVYSYEKTLLVPLPDVHRSAAHEAVAAANWTRVDAAAGAKLNLCTICPQNITIDVYDDGTRKIRGAT